MGRKAKSMKMKRSSAVEASAQKAKLAKGKRPKSDMDALAEEQIARVRRLCSTLPGTTEKLSHGEPTFFVAKRVYAMFSNNHHSDGHVAVWIPVEPGYQAALLKDSPRKYYYPPYVGREGLGRDRIEPGEWR